MALKNFRKFNTLKNLSIIRAREALDYQRKKYNWTFYEERQFMENLLQTRFNFLIVIYAMFFNVFFRSAEEFRIIISICGFIITLLIWLTIYRIYLKLDVILKILHNMEDMCTFKMINEELGKRVSCLPNVNKLIGIFIPFLLTVSFIVGFVWCISKCITC